MLRLGLDEVVLGFRNINLATRLTYLGNMYEKKTKRLTLTSISRTAKAAASGAVRLRVQAVWLVALVGRTRAKARAAPAPLFLPSSTFSVRPHSRLEHNPVDNTKI